MQDLRDCPTEHYARYRGAGLSEAISRRSGNLGDFLRITFAIVASSPGISAIWQEP